MDRRTPGERLLHFFVHLSKDPELWMRLRTEPRTVVLEAEVLQEREKQWLIEGNDRAIKEALAPYRKVAAKILVPFVHFLPPDQDD